MKLVYDKKLDKMVPLEPAKPAPAACTKFDQPSKKPLRSARGRRQLKRGGFITHRSDGAGVDPSQVLEANKHAESIGHGNVTFDSKTGEAIMKNGSHREWRHFLKKIGMHDKGSYL